MIPSRNVSLLGARSTGQCGGPCDGRDSPGSSGSPYAAGLCCGGHVRDLRVYDARWVAVAGGSERDVRGDRAPGARRRRQPRRRAAGARSSAAVDHRLVRRGERADDERGRLVVARLQRRDLQLPRAGLRWTMGGVLGISILVFLFSPKTIGTALGAENLDIQTPGLWIMASSAGVFCAVALLVCWLVALRRESLAPELELASVPPPTGTSGPPRSPLGSAPRRGGSSRHSFPGKVIWS